MFNVHLGPETNVSDPVCPSLQGRGPVDPCGSYCGYALASKLHVSGPLAMVVAGLMIGNHGRALAMSETTRRYLDMFWELLDEIINAVLFVLIGMEVLLVVFSVSELVAAGLAIMVTLLARLLTVGLPVKFLGAPSSCREDPARC